MKVLDLFAGIGGFTLGLERAGFETVAFCEIEPYAQKVLKKNWPDVPIYEDVRTITADRLLRDGIKPDIITGGFPCQDLSVAGLQGGIDAERSGLWSDCARLLGELRPKYAIFENVTALLSRPDWFQRVLWDIHAVGYDAEWHCIPASHIGAPHQRDRIWIVAYPRHRTRGNTDSIIGRQDAPRRQWAKDSNATSRPSEDVANPVNPRPQGGIYRGKDSQGQSQLGYVGRRSSAHRQPRQDAWDIEPDVGRLANGIPNRSHRLKCLGNAVVPQIPELIGRAIIRYEANL